MSDWILDVSTLNEYVHRSLEADPMLRSLRLRGEISNFRPTSSGHWYFTLKDDRSRIGCVMFRSSAARVTFRPQDGMAVILAGRVSLYEATGAYQFYADSMRPEGVGSLYQQFEALKARLAAEGFFDQIRKRPLPYRPRKIAVVTSRTGAVLHDICRVSRERDPGVPLVLLPVQVQGEGAAEEIAAAIRQAGMLPEVDVIITGRGGGSIEDLWAFNEEIVARAIAASPIPVISAVGHETDVTIADFVADRRAATPSNAAEIAVPDRDEIIAGLREAGRHLMESLRADLKRREVRLMRARTRLTALGPEQKLGELRARALRLRGQLDRVARDKIAGLAPRLAQAQVRLDAAIDRRLQSHRELVARLRARLSALNPSAVLERGYALVTAGDRVITTRADAAKRNRMTLRFQDGTLDVIKEKDHGDKKEADL